MLIVHCFSNFINFIGIFTLFAKLLGHFYTIDFCIEGFTLEPLSKGAAPPCDTPPPRWNHPRSHNSWPHVQPSVCIVLSSILLCTCICILLCAFSNMCFCLFLLLLHCLEVLFPSSGILEAFGHFCSRRSLAWWAWRLSMFCFMLKVLCFFSVSTVATWTLLALLMFLHVASFLVALCFHLQLQ